MCRLYLIPTGPTVWQCQDRLESVTGSPLADHALAALERLCGPLAGERIDAVYSGDAAGERQSADAVARELGARQRIAPDLREIHYGLWQGLTRAEIRRRQPKLYRDWMDQPGSSCPPAGETFDEADERLGAAVEGILRRHKHGAAALVLRPVMIALLRCRLDRLPLTDLWELSQQPDAVCIYDVNGQTKRLQTIGEPHGGA
ncbi:MAG: histidine phosphatase family protein [Phycisphaerae bacterium]|nr:histidine phosphatase family protein [Phycisphaerae bacterium]